MSLGVPGCPAGRTAVLGLGNPILGDDGVGLAVAREVRCLLEQRPIPGVDVLESSRAGFEVIELLRGYRRAIIVDCLDVPAPQPGRVRQLSLQEVAGSARLTGGHEVTIGTAFHLAAHLGIPMPDHVEIFGIEGEEMAALREDLTPAVEAAVQPLARRIYATLAVPPPSPTARQADLEFSLTR